MDFNLSKNRLPIVEGKNTSSHIKSQVIDPPSPSPIGRSSEPPIVWYHLHYPILTPFTIATWSCLPWVMSIMFTMLPVTSQLQLLSYT
jgi:hypothetical protein